MEFPDTVIECRFIDGCEPGLMNQGADAVFCYMETGRTALAVAAVSAEKACKRPLFHIGIVQYVLKKDLEGRGIRPRISFLPSGARAVSP